MYHERTPANESSNKAPDMINTINWHDACSVTKEGYVYLPANYGHRVFYIHHTSRNYQQVDSPMSKVSWPVVISVTQSTQLSFTHTIGTSTEVAYVRKKRLKGYSYDYYPPKPRDEDKYMNGITVIGSGT